MRGHDHVVEVEQLAAGLLNGLMLEHVETGLEQRAVLQAGDQLIFLDEAAAGAVDERGGGLHPAELLTADGVMGGGNLRQMDADEVGLLPDLLGGLLQLAEVAHLVLGEVGIVADDLHAEAVLGLLHGQLGDTTAADHAQSLAAQLIGVLHAHADEEVAAAELAIHIGEALGAGQHQQNRVLGHGVGVAGGGEDHLNVLVGGVIHIDVVEAGALLADDLEVGAGVHHLCGDGLGAAHDGVGLVLGQLLDVGFLIVVGADLHLKVVLLEDVGRHLVEFNGVVDFKLGHDASPLNTFIIISQKFLPLPRFYTVSRRKARTICRIPFMFFMRYFSF